MASKSKIWEFFIFHRNGTCLCHLDLTEEDKIIISNKAINASINKESEHRYKLWYGMWFSMKSFVKTLSPAKNNDILKSFSTSNYKLHYVEFLNGLRFVCTSTPGKDQRKNDFGDEWREIHKWFYTSLISKNIFVNQDEQIKNEVFLELVYDYLCNVNRS